MAAELPRLRSFDCSLALLADPYRFIGERCRELNSDVFEARLMLQPTIFLHGAEAAELFYDAELFQRSGAAPEPLRATLFGEGTVQSLDGAMHRQRKALFVAATAPASVDALVAETRRAWQRVVPKSPGIGPVSLYALAREALTRAACAWAGVPLAESEVPLRTRS
jgi:fatty-acid peroxygenase